MADSNVLEIVDLSIEFNTFEGTAKVIDGIDIVVKEKEVVGLVGESGCGKTITAKAILGILPAPACRIRYGKIVLTGFDLLNLPEKESLRLRRKGLSFVPQDPTSSLNPLFTVEQQMTYMKKWKETEGFSLIDFIDHQLRRNAFVREREMALEYLEKVRLADPERVMKSYPFELSGGMRQRIFIAMALMSNPSLVIFDEPTTNLDVSVQDEILDLIEDKIKEFGNSVMYITHDLGVAKRLCNRVYVLYAGSVVETAGVDQIFETPKHPYTRDLLQVIPKIYGEMSDGIPGRIPNYYDPPSGCRFHPRCRYKMPICEREKPRLKTREGFRNHWVACHLMENGANE